MPVICSFIFLSALTFEPTLPQDGVSRTQKHIYKKRPSRTLQTFLPDDWQEGDRRPALVIFRCNVPFHREYFRSRGVVVIKPNLAPVNSGQLPGLSLDKIAQLPKPRHQVEDAKSVIRFLRQNATDLGIDPQRIVATGTSGGGDLALQTAVNTAFEDEQDDTSISCRPDALVLFCPAFDGIHIWFVKTETLLQQTRKHAPAFESLLPKFVTGTSEEYVTPRDHRRKLIELAKILGKERNIDQSQVTEFQKIIELFNARDWQLLHPWKDALEMSASRLIKQTSLPPTLIMHGDRDHLIEHQNAFIRTARTAGRKFDVKLFAGGGHSFMTQPAFEAKSAEAMHEFLRKIQMLPAVQREAQ